MSILIGSGLTNLTSRERIQLQSDTQSNLITMRSGMKDINIVFDPDNSNYVLGKTSTSFGISQGSTLITAFQGTGVTFNTPVSFMSNVGLKNISVTSLATPLVTTCNIAIDCTHTRNNAPCFTVTSNATTLLSASPDGVLNVKNTLVAQQVVATGVVTVPSIQTMRITSSNNPNVYMYFANDASTSTFVQGDLNISGTLIAANTIYKSPNIAFQSITISSNSFLSSLTLANSCNITQPTLFINHSNYGGTGSSSQPPLPVYIGVNSNPALVINNQGEFMIGTSNTRAFATIAASNPASNILAIVGAKGVESEMYVNRSANIGLGTSTPLNRFHITQNTLDSTSNSAIFGIYASDDLVNGTWQAGDIFAAYSNEIGVFGVSAAGDVTCSTLTGDVQTSSIVAAAPGVPINYNAASISNVDTTYSATLSNSGTIVTQSLSTYNLSIPNVSIMNIMGYYGVFQPTLQFTGTNLVYSASAADTNAAGVAAPPGKVVVRADTPNPSGGLTPTYVGLNVLGTNNSSLRVTTTGATAQPYLELIGPTTATYISGTTGTNNSTQNMFYISHQSGNTTIDSATNAQFKIIAGTGSIYDNTMYSLNPQQGGSGGVSIGTGAFINSANIPNLRLQVRGGFLVDRLSGGNAPILYATESSSSGGPIAVGVGTTSPAHELHVNGNSYASGNVYAGTRLGVGTTAPVATASMHVVGNGYFTTSVGIGAGSAAPNYNLDVTGNTWVSSNAYVGNAVAVGTTTPAPSQSLHVAGNAYISTGLCIGGASPTLAASTGYALDVAGSARFANVVAANVSGYATYVLNSNQTSIQTLSNVTDLGIGVTNLNLGTSSTAVNVMGQLWANVRTPQQPFITSLTATNGVTISTLIATNPIQGNILGTATTVTNPMQSNILSLPKVTSIGQSGVVTNVAGSLTTSSNSTFYGPVYTYAGVMSISDSNIKTDLTVINSALDKLDTLVGYTYDNTHTGRRETGLLAQDVQRVLPEAVCLASANANANANANDLLTISYGNLAGLFVQAIKELRANVDDIKKRINDTRFTCDHI